MPRFSLTSHCQVCGREITQAGSARKWIHIDQFYGRADHDPVPRENSKYLLPKPAATADKAAAPLSDAERRRRLRGEAAVETPAQTPRRPRAQVTEAHDPDIDEAARRLRRLRLGLDPDGHD